MAATVVIPPPATTHLTAADLVDDDTFASASATTVPSSESVKAYVDAEVGGVVGGGAGSDTTAIHDDTAGEIAAVAAKTTLSVDDKVLIEDSAEGNAKKSVLVGNLGQGANLLGTFAQLQAITPKLGQMGWPSDSPYLFICRVAGTWSYRYPGIGFDVTPPPSASWTARNSASVAVVGGTRVMTMAVGAGVNYEFETRAVPSTPYYLEVAFILDATSNGEYGPVWFQTSDAKFVVVGANPVAGTNHQDYTDYATWASHNGQANAPGGSIVILRLVDDGANRKVYFVNPATRTLSQLGADDARTNHITADAVGWGGYPNSAVSGATMALVHWAPGTP